MSTPTLPFDAALHAKPKMRDVAFLQDVFFAFDGKKSPLLKRGVRAVFDEITVLANLRADEPALDIGMDLSRRLRGFGAFGNEPGAGFFLAGGKKTDQSEQFTSGRGQDRKSTRL